MASDRERRTPRVAGDHHAGLPRRHQVHRGRSGAQGEEPVGGGRTPATLEMPQHDGARLLAGALLDLEGDALGDAAKANLPPGHPGAARHHLAARRLRSHQQTRARHRKAPGVGERSAPGGEEGSGPRSVGDNCLSGAQLAVDGVRQIARAIAEGPPGAGCQPSGRARRILDSPTHLNASLAPPGGIHEEHPTDTNHETCQKQTELRHVHLPQEGNPLPSHDISWTHRSGDGGHTQTDGAGVAPRVSAGCARGRRACRSRTPTRRPRQAGPSTRARATAHSTARPGPDGPAHRA